MIPTELIEKALALTGKTIYDVSTDYNENNDFSIEKFCYYLLSDLFLEKFTEIYKQKAMLQKESKYYKGGVITSLGNAINKYQKGNEKPLLTLLSKI